MKIRILFYIMLYLMIMLSCSKKTQKSSPSILSTQLPVQVTPLPWTANFNDSNKVYQSNLDDWEIILDAPTKEVTWKMEQGLLVQGSDIYVKEKNYQQFLGTHIVAGDTNWTDYNYQCKLLNRGQGGFGMLFRYQNPQNYYRFLLVKDPKFGGPFLQLDKCVAGNFQKLARIERYGYPDHQQTLDMRIQTFSDTIRTYIGMPAASQPKFVFEVQDTTFLRGKIGFTTFANPGLCIDNVLVTQATPASQPALATDSTKIQPRLDHAVGNYSFAIRGLVFNDLNQNGLREDHEPGVPGIAVSDGREIVFTDAHGLYVLKNSFKDARFVFITTPANFKKQSGGTLFNFYHPLHDSLGQRTFQFPLIQQEFPDSLPVRFIQISDINLNDQKSQTYFSQTVDQIILQQPEVAFIAATGDLVENGAIPAQLADYSKIIKKVSTPIFSIVGNHDLNNGLNRLNNFYQLLGPDYFSFEYANWHFIVLNTVINSKKQQQWLQNDLNNCSPAKNIIIFQHSPPSKGQLTQYSPKNVKAIFSGQRHSNNIIEFTDILSYNTPPFLSGGLDNSPAGFRVVTLESDSVHSQFHLTNENKKNHIVVPAPGSIYSNPHLQILLNVPEETFEIIRITYLLSRPNSFDEFGELNQIKKLAWHKYITEALFDGDFNLKLTIFTSDSQQIELESTFTVKLDQESHPENDNSWPMFKLNPARTGYRSQTLEPPLVLKWFGITYGSMDYASPIVVNDVVAIASKDRHNLTYNNICVFDAVTGRFIWDFKTVAAINHSLVATEKQIFGQDISGNIYSLDLKTGQLLWQQSVEGVEQHSDESKIGFNSAPLIFDNCLFVGGATSLTAIQIEDGSVLWSKNIISNRPFLPASAASCASPSAELDYLLMGHSQRIHAFEPHTGKRQWEFPINDTIGTCLIYQNIGYFCSRTGELIAIDLKSGQKSWSRKLSEAGANTTPTSCDSLIIAGSGDGQMIASHYLTGRQIWSFECQESILPISPYRTDLVALTGSPIVTGSVVYFGATDGFLYALNAYTGQLIWKHNLGCPILSTPAVSGRRLYISTFDGNIYCFRTCTLYRETKS